MDDPDERKMTFWGKVKVILLRDLLMFLILIAVVIGFAIGISINGIVQKLEEPTKTTVLTVLGFLGELLMNMLKMLILPLVISGIMVGLAALSQQSTGRLGGMTVGYYIATTLLAVILGVVLTLLIQPGSNTQPDIKEKQKDVIALDSFLDLLRSVVPPNIVAACFQQAKSTVGTIQIKDGFQIVNNFSDPMVKGKLLRFKWNGTHNISYYQLYKTVKKTGSVIYSSGSNILGLVVFSLAVGLVVGKLGPKAQVFIDFVTALNNIVMTLLGYVMWYSPIGICSLIITKFASMKDIAATFESLGMYIFTLILGLAIHSLAVLPGLYFLFTRRNPLRFFHGIIQALLTAFGTNSSFAALPVTFRCLEENNKIDGRITNFILPIGTTINMDGTAMYEAVATIFIAQAYNYSLSFGQIIAISMASALVSFGAPGVPQISLAIMLVVLQTAGLPEDSIILIVPVDWFVARLCTVVNVISNAVGAGIVYHVSRKNLHNLEYVHDNSAVAVHDDTKL